VYLDLFESGSELNTSGFMKVFLTGVSFAILLLTSRVPARAQSLGVFESTSGGIAVLQSDCYKNPAPIYWCCYSCPDNETPHGEAGSPPPYGLNESRYCHPLVQLTKEVARLQFLYKLKLRNEGEKTIRAIEWEYIFIDRATQSEVARHQFLSEEKVRPGKRKTLIEYSTSPPTKVISVTALSQPDGYRFIERVVIKRVIYKDGSVWELPSSPR